MYRPAAALHGHLITQSGLVVFFNVFFFVILRNYLNIIFVLGYEYICTTTGLWVSKWYTTYIFDMIRSTYRYFSYIETCIIDFPQLLSSGADQLISCRCPWPRTPHSSPLPHAATEGRRFPLSLCSDSAHKYHRDCTRLSATYGCAGAFIAADPLNQLFR